MPPWLTLSAIKDGVIVIAIIALAWWVYRAGENAVHVKDMKALQAQMAHMQQTEEKWQSQQSRATAQERSDVQAINSGAVVRPLSVRLCVNRPSSEAVLSSTTTATTGSAAKAGGADMRPGPDIGPAVQAFERKYETALAQCRAVIQEWPK